MTCIAVSILKQDKWILMEIWEETRVQNEKGEQNYFPSVNILKQDKLFLMGIWEELRVQNDTGSTQFSLQSMSSNRINCFHTTYWKKSSQQMTLRVNEFPCSHCPHKG